SSSRLSGPAISSPPATGSAPPGTKSFWKSTISTASMSALRVGSGARPNRSAAFVATHRPYRVMQVVPKPAPAEFLLRRNVWLVVMAAFLAALVLTSPAFSNGGTIPKRYTCDGANVSPALRWTAPPRGTASLSLTVFDPDAPNGGFLH